MKNTLFIGLPLSLLTLVACAPVATLATTSAATTRVVSNPLTLNAVYLLKGNDQNGKTFEGKLKLTTAATEYDSSRGVYYIDADQGFLVYRTGAIVQAWLQVGDNNIVCVPYQGQGQLPYRATAIQGNDDEIKSLLNRYSGNDSSYYGNSNCVISEG